MVTALERHLHRLVVVIALAAAVAMAAEQPPSANDNPTAELIDQLVNIDGQAAGLHPTAWVRGFLGESQSSKFAGGVIGSVAPKTFPQMRELVRRGVSSLPLLIGHINDGRLTKLTIGGELFDFAYFGAEYDPKDRLLGREENGAAKTIDRERRVPHRRYTVRVGDVCYALIGQIVNRNLLPVRYQPSGGFVINSPIEEPSLVKLVNLDWAGLDTKGHAACLIADAGNSDTEWISGPALQRLRFYYPDEYRRLRAGPLKKTIEEFELRESKKK